MNWLMGFNAFLWVAQYVCCVLNAPLMVHSSVYWTIKSSFSLINWWKTTYTQKGKDRKNALFFASPLNPSKQTHGKCYVSIKEQINIDIIHDSVELWWQRTLFTVFVSFFILFIHIHVVWVVLLHRVLLVSTLWIGKAQGKVRYVIRIFIHLQST